MSLSDYAHGRLAARVDLAPRTRALYADLLARWIDADVPRPEVRGRVGTPIRLGDCEVRTLTPALVREWAGAVQHAARDRVRAREAAARTGSRGGHPARGSGRTQTAHAYRLLRQVLNVATREGLLTANPAGRVGAACRLRPRAARRVTWTPSSRTTRTP